uniref:Uncharacterized protein n=2 Tax=Tetranychus urticae TaxID=32264 RepID=T1K534_TETUR
MGKHVRRGTGASPQILSRLKSILQDKQRLRETGLVPSNWKRKKMAKAYN